MTSNSTPSTANSVPLTNPMDWLFGEIHGLFGNPFLDKWRSGHIVDGKDTGIENMKTTWATKIRENGMHLGEIKRGLAGCERSKFPPSWPEFLQFCRPAVDPTAAYYEALAGLQAREGGEIGTWSHPAIYFAAVKVGAFDLRQQSYSSIRGRWEKALADEMGKGVWDEIKQPPLKLTHSGPTPVSREFVAAISRQLNATRPEKKVDHRAWAHRIIEREKRKDKTLTPLQIRMAKEALRVPLDGL